MVIPSERVAKEFLKRKRPEDPGCPTAKDMGIHSSSIEHANRVVTLDVGPRPNYYGGKESTYEVFNVLEAWKLDKDFYLGNVVKYVARAGKKDPAKYREDLQKAMVYLQKRIDSLDK